MVNGHIKVSALSLSPCKDIVVFETTPFYNFILRLYIEDNQMTQDEPKLPEVSFNQFAEQLGSLHPLSSPLHGFVAGPERCYVL